MNYILKISVFGFLLLHLSACTDALKLEPVSSISNASFWKTENDASGVVYGMYNQLRILADNNNLFFWGDARSDLIGQATYGHTVNAIYWNNMLDRNTPGPDWQGWYSIIHHANLIIKYVPGIKFSSDAKKNDILGQAYAMRAFSYFWLTRIYGETILIKEPTESFDPVSLQLERSPVKDVFDFIKADLEESLKLFPNNAFPTGRNVWSKMAVNTLKADVYLWTGKRLNGGTADFTTALTALNAVTGTDVQLLDEFDRVFDYDNKGNKEILFAIRFQLFESGENWGVESYMNATSMSSEFDKETLDAIGVLGTRGGDFAIAENVRAQFSAKDKRKKGTFGEMFKVNKEGVRSYYGTFMAKYNGTINGGVRMFVDDIVMYRYADVLLLKAEAKNALKQDPSDEMNQIRKRAYGTNFAEFAFVNGTQEANDRAILQERLFEFAFEGKRWFDVIRFDKAFEIVPSLRARAGQTGLLLFPIGEAVLSLETKVKQNPGY